MASPLNKFFLKIRKIGKISLYATTPSNHIHNYRTKMLETLLVKKNMGETDYKGLPRDKIPWDPKINPNKCTTCEKCIKFCHMNAFKTKTLHDKKKTIEINPNRCVIFCRGCENICPQGAISHPDEAETQKIVDNLRNNQRSCHHV